MSKQKEGGISWTQETWNVVTGCTPVSAGCANCYAARYAKRGIGDFQSGPWSEWQNLGKESRQRHRYLRPFSEVRTHPDRLELPLHWRDPKRIFTPSMGDLFHPDVPFEFIVEVFRTAALAHWHTFQILTKRPERMLGIVPEIQELIIPQLVRLYKNGGIASKDTFRALDIKRRDKVEFRWPLPNVWLGCTVENQAAADERRPYLMPLADHGWNTFVSYEPALGPIDWYEWGFIRWAIVGGETGPGARPCHPDWVRSLRDQCQAAGVAFHLKQMGEWTHIYNSKSAEAKQRIQLTVNGTDGSDLHNSDNGGDVWMYRVGKKAAGRMLDGKEWLEFPEVRA